MTVELVIEVLVVVLLAATCIYCAALYRKLRGLQRGQTEMATLMRAFDEATQRAERNLAIMQEEGVAASRELDVVAARARALGDELGVMVHAGKRIADRIEGAVHDARQTGLHPENKTSRAA